MTRNQQISLAAVFAAGFALPLWILWRSRRRAEAKACATDAAAQPARRKAQAVAAEAPAPAAPAAPAARAAVRRQPAPTVEATDPLSQAEILASFGRRAEAEAILAAAVDAGDLTPEELALFWTRHEVARAKRAAARPVAEKKPRAATADRQVKKRVRPPES